MLGCYAAIYAVSAPWLQKVAFPAKRSGVQGELDLRVAISLKPVDAGPLLGQLSLALGAPKPRPGLSHHPQHDEEQGAPVGVSRSWREVGSLAPGGNVSERVPAKTGCFP